jgi:hypothetical protein
MGRRARKFDLSDEVKSLIARGQRASIGETILYAEWNTIAGTDVRIARHLLYRAFYRLTKDAGIVFGCIEGEGYKRLAPSEIVGVVADYLPRINRATRRAFLRGSVAQQAYEQLSREKQVELNMAQALLGTLAHCSSAGMIRESRKHCENDKPPILPGDLSAFEGS